MTIMKMKNLIYAFILSVISLIGCDTLKDDNALQISIAEEIKVKPNSNALFNLNHGLKIEYDRIEIKSPANYGTVSLPNINFFNYKSGSNVDVGNDLVILEAYNADKLVGKALLTYKVVRTGENDCGTFPFSTEYSAIRGDTINTTVNRGDTVKFTVEYADIFCDSNYESTYVGLSTGAVWQSDPNNIIMSGALNTSESDTFEFALWINLLYTGRGAAVLEVISFNTKNPSIDLSLTTSEAGSIAAFDPNEVVEYYPFFIEIEAK